VKDIVRVLGLPARTLPYTSAEPVGIDALQLLTGKLDFREWIPGQRPA